jgi:vacuolar-type H+-ATPase subunit H
MNDILAAEQQAREAVEQCRAKAARIVAEAEERARRIANRAEARIRLTHRIADQSVERALRELRSTESSRVPATPEGDAREVLDKAVEALVDEMLGGSQ